ncbi:unnamed protein product, partial [Didymodactylos carnosus]
DIMEQTLNEIDDKFQSGKYTEAITDMQEFIDKMQTEESAKPLLYKAFDHLGRYLNFMGKHVEAVQAWEDGLKVLEDSGLDSDKLINWIHTAIQAARITHRQGKNQEIFVT